VSSRNGLHFPPRKLLAHVIQQTFSSVSDASSLAKSPQQRIESPEGKVSSGDGRLLSLATISHLQDVKLEPVLRM
jgi:hypothetical protein